jgi:hypothetical protein
MVMYKEITAKNRKILYNKVYRFKKQKQINSVFSVQYTTSIEIHGLYVAIVGYTVEKPVCFCEDSRFHHTWPKYY